jgi:hypothetical protein
VEKRKEIILKALNAGHDIDNFFIDDERHHLNLKQSEDEMVALYMEEAERCFKEHRPLFISHHFYRWNQGAYRRAGRRAILEMKKKYPTEFLTISELYQRLTDRH